MFVHQSITPKLTMLILTLLTLLSSLLTLSLSATPPLRIPSNNQAVPLRHPLFNLHPLLRFNPSAKLPRQSTIRCPGQSFDCDGDTLCCPGYCCPTAFPFCAGPPALEYCFNADDKGTCQQNGEEVTGTLCLRSASVCCSDPDYDKCTDTFPVACVNDDGFIACGNDDPQPGVSCLQGDACCPNPQRCCTEDDGSIGCCEPDEPGVFGGPRPVQAPLNKSPARTPGAVNPGPGTVPTETPPPVDGSGGSGDGDDGGDGDGDGGGSGGGSDGGGAPGESSPQPSSAVSSPSSAVSPPSPVPSSSIGGVVTTPEGEGEEAGIITPEATAVAVGGEPAVASATPSPMNTGTEEVGGDVTNPMETGEMNTETGEVETGGVTVEPTEGDGGGDGGGASGTDEGDEAEMTASPEDDGPICWPAGASVELRDGSVKRMEEVETGDVVRVSAGGFSRVFMWTHRDGGYQGRRYVRVRLEDGREVTATEGHMVYVRRSEGEYSNVYGRVVVEMQDVKLGDGMWVLEEGSEVVKQVVKSWRVWDRGLYNPQTVHGDIVVDGVVATCYTKFVERGMAHGLLAPLRALYRWSGISVSVSV